MVEYQRNENRGLDLKKKSSYPSGKAFTESNRLLISNMEEMDRIYSGGNLQRKVTDGRTPVFSFEDVEEHYCSGKRDGMRGGYGGDGPEGKEAGGELKIHERAPEAGMKKAPVVQRVAGEAIAAGALGLLAVGYGAIKLRQWWQRRRENRQEEENTQEFQDEVEPVPEAPELVEETVVETVKESVEESEEESVEEKSVEEESVEEKSMEEESMEEESMEEAAALPQPMETEEQRAINARFIRAKGKFTEFQSLLYSCLPFVHNLSILNDLISNSQDILDTVHKPDDFYHDASEFFKACIKQLNEEKDQLYDRLCRLFDYYEKSRASEFESLINKLVEIQPTDLESLFLGLRIFFDTSQELSLVLKTWMHIIRSSSQDQEITDICNGSAGISDCYYLAEAILQMFGILERNPSKAGKAQPSALSSPSSSAPLSSPKFEPGYTGRRINPYRSTKGGKGVGNFSAIHLHLVGGRNEHLKLSGEGEQIRITERREMMAALRLLVGSPNYREREGYESCLRWLCQSLGIDHSPFTNILPENEESVLNSQ